MTCKSYTAMNLSAAGFEKPVTIIAAQGLAR